MDGIIFIFIIVAIVLSAAIHTRRMSIAVAMIPIMLVLFIGTIVIDDVTTSINNANGEEIIAQTEHSTLITPSKSSFCYGKSGTHIQMICEDARTCSSKPVDCDAANGQTTSGNLASQNNIEGQLNDIGPGMNFIMFFIIIVVGVAVVLAVVTGEFRRGVW